jgi:RNA polymerase sigma-70 factor (ECF subfamily)
MVILLSVIHNIENRNKLEALYNKYSFYAYNVAYAILHDKALAQDAVHEAFINIIKNIDKIGDIDCNKTEAFIVIIVRNGSINIFNKRKKRSDVSFEDIEGQLSESGPSVEEIVINNDTFYRAAYYLKSLNPSFADILLLKYYYQYNDEEIANILNITHQNARVRLYRARKSLLTLLSQDKD